LSKLKSLYSPGNLHFHAIAIVLLVLSRFNWFVWPLLLLYIRFVNPTVRRMMVLYAMIIFFPFNYEVPQTCEVRSQTEFSSVCVNQVHVRLNKSFPVGSVLEVKGTLRPPTPPVLVGFQRDRYYKSQGIHLELLDQGSQVIDQRESLFQLRETFMTYLSRFEPTSQAYLRALLAGDR